MPDNDPNDIRGVNIPRRQRPEDLDNITAYAISMIPINGSPQNVDESMLFEDDALGDSNVGN